MLGHGGDYWKNSPFRNYSVNSTSKVWGNYFLGILLGNACQARYRSAFSQKHQVGSQRYCPTWSKGVISGDTSKRPLLSPLLTRHSHQSGAVASGSFACATAFLPRVLGKAKLPANPLRADSHLSAVRMENGSHEAGKCWNSSMNHPGL